MMKVAENSQVKPLNLYWRPLKGWIEKCEILINSCASLRLRFV